MRKEKNQMKKLFLLLYSILFLVGCGDFDLSLKTEPFSECSDKMAMNYNNDCSTTINGEPADCPWGTEDCIYCTDLYETEEERWEHCCNNPFAENFNDSLLYNNWSQDKTYCIFE